jgi:biopolymer transport protein ExbD
MSKKRDDSNIKEKEEKSFVNISDISTYKRKEMACPKCWTKGLEPHPVRAKEYDGIGALFRGTICPNPQCENNSGVPESTIKKQYRKPSIMEKIMGDTPTYGLEEDDQYKEENEESGIFEKIAKQFGFLKLKKVQYLIVIIVAFVVIGQGASAIGLFTNGSGPEPPSNNTTQKGIIKNDTVSQNETFNVDYEDDDFDNMLISIKPQKAQVRSETIRISNQRSFGVNGQIIGGNISVDPSAVENNYRKEYDVNRSSFQFSLEKIPNNITLEMENISGQVNTNKQQLVRNINGQTNINQDFGNISGLANIEITNGEQIDVSKNGRWDGTDPVINSPSDMKANLTLTGISENIEKTKSGTVTSNSITHNFNSQPTQATINFNGGDQQTGSSESLNTVTLRQSRNEATRKERTIIRSEQDQTVNLDISYNIEENRNLISAGYSINGIDTTITEGKSSETIQINEGETLSAWIKSDKSGGYSQDKNYIKPDKQPSIIDTRLSQNTVKTGQQVQVTVDIRNSNSNPYNTPINLFKNGQKLREKSKVIDGNSQQTITAGYVSFSREGVHTVSVNEGEQIQVNVGNGQIEYGKGEIEVSGRTQQNNEPKIKMDYNNDGNYECETTPTGECEINDLSQGSNTLQINQQNVQNTQYTIRYNTQTKTQNLRVDYNNDGNYEIRNKNLKNNQQINREVQLSQGSNKIDIEANGNVDYQIETGKTVTGVKNITLETENQNIVEEKFVETPYKISTGINEGKQNLIANGDTPYRLEVKWETTRVEREYPNVILNGQEACSGIPICTITQSQLQDKNIVQFDGNNYPEKAIIEYSLANYPEQATVTVNQDREIYFNKTQIITREKIETELSSEENIISIDNNQLIAVVDVKYTNSNVKSPNLIIENSTGEQKYEVGDDYTQNGYLTREYTFNISSKDITPDSTYKITSEEDNPINIKIRKK